MKNVILVLSFCLFACVVKAQATWEYPVKPGSEEWRVTSYDEKVEKSQPPKELLNSWDTETLLRYCVDYPFNKVIGMFNNPNDGFKRAYEQATVWQEFIQRKDALGIFTNYFEARPYKKLFEISEEVRINERFILYFLEKMITETNFLDNLDS